MLEPCYEARLLFSFENCCVLGLDNRDITAFVHFSLMRAIHNNFCCAKVCYPGRTIPAWFRYTQMTESSIKIELVPTSPNHLLGFLCCCILPRYTLDIEDSFSLYRMFDYKHQEIKDRTKLVSDLSYELMQDHVFLWYEPLVSTSKGTQR